MNFPLFLRFVIVVSVVALTIPLCNAMDYVDFFFQKEKRQIEGQFLGTVEGNRHLVFETRDRQFLYIRKDEVIKRKSDNEPFAYYSEKETVESLKKEFPPSNGYEILDQRHFLVVYSTSRAFANWYGRLLEKLYTGYAAYWKRKGVDLETTDYPLIAVVLSSKKSYLEYAANEGVTVGENMCAYYNQRTNRVVMYDISGKEQHNEGDRRRATAKMIEQFLQQPGSYTNVETVVHEAAHQVGFNCGMHTRLAPNPTWLCEGLATFHEVPDGKSSIGWTLGPRLNPERLAMLNEVLKHRDERPFESILVNDGLFSNGKTALTAYGASWGLIYYCANKKPDALVKYLNILRQKTPETEDSAEIRLRDFRQCFGNDWDAIYTDMASFYRKEIRKTQKK